MENSQIKTAKLIITVYKIPVKIRIVMKKVLIIGNGTIGSLMADHCIRQKTTKLSSTENTKLLAYPKASYNDPLSF